MLSARISRFAYVGAFGAVVNLLIMMALTNMGVGYIAAALVAGETTIVSNFVMQEKFAFNDQNEHRRSLSRRFLHSFTFNTMEALARIPALWLLVELLHMNSTLAQAGTLVAAFFLRYAYHVKFVYDQSEPFVDPTTLYPAPKLQPSPDG
ncbi:MAG: hypothetical protein NVS2B15_25820 [Pseudarthrobacter sp.]